ncbi:putative nonribosomal peptide synthase [Xylaria sp. FL1042]|nr:putative nonribosomal peptide synthase [Xylaria sp. FL1042]
MPGINGNHDLDRLDGTVVDLFDQCAAKTPDRVAAAWQGETLTYAELRAASLQVSRALLAAGVRPRARVPVLTQMSLEMLPAVIGILRIGACYAPMDVAVWSRSRITAALSELSSSVAVVTSCCPGLQLPVVTINFQKEWLKMPPENVDNLYAELDVIRGQFRADDLAWIIFTSGTTGKPKGVMVRHRGIYAVCVVEPNNNDLDAFVEKGVRCLLAYSIAFDGCAATIWTTLTKGGTLVLASPSDFPEVAATCDVLNLTPSMLAALDIAGPYDRVQYIFLGAEAPSFEVVRSWIRLGKRVFTTYGPSEATCYISIGELNDYDEPPFGDLIPGVKVVLVDDKLHECDYGEIMISGPGLAAGYLNNPELTAKKFIQWNGERFYRTGDLARRTNTGQLIWAGRADSLIKNRGFLINLETEVEPALLNFPSVRLAVALKWRDRLVGCVQPSTVDVEELRGFLKRQLDPFVVPDLLLAMDNFPLNVNSKTDRHALAVQLENSIEQGDEAALFKRGHLTPYDALRMAFSSCLHVPFERLDAHSSFTSLGGNSLTAIKISNCLKNYDFSISVAQILRLDTIDALQDNLVNMSSPGDSDLEESGEVIATDTQRQLLRKSLENPIVYALISSGRYSGNPKAVPTPIELHDACVKALSAHSIFRKRFDLTTFEIYDLGRLNLDWQEVIVEEDGFEEACAAAEDKAWSDAEKVSRAEVEVPFFHVTCVYAPNSKRLAFISCIHHVLTDVFSSAILSRDMERALAGKEVPPGPRFEDFARFWQKHKRRNLARAIHTFERMMAPLPATAVLRVPSPRAPPPPDTQQKHPFDLVRISTHLAVGKSAIDDAARRYRVTTSTLVYASWALFLAKLTGWDRVAFSLSMSGRTVPWPQAQSVVGALLGRMLFSTGVPRDDVTTVGTWLAEEVHTKTLDVIEFEGMTNCLPEALVRDPRANTTNVLCFLDVPQPSSSDWTVTDKQCHNYLLDWYIFQDGDAVTADFEFSPRRVDADWVREVAGIPARILEGLVNARSDTLVGDLLL